MKYALFSLLLLSASLAEAQKYMTRTGKVQFLSSTPVEKIEAVNNEAAAVLDAKTGEIVFQVPVKSFKFEKALMEEHFNENYMESDKFPKSDYKGKIADMNKIDFSKDGTYPVTTSGTLSMHGVSKDISEKGTLTIKDGKVTINAKFVVRPADYGIKIPSVVSGKIAEKIDVMVNCILNPLNK